MTFVHNTVVLSEYRNRFLFISEVLDEFEVLTAGTTMFVWHTMTKLCNGPPTPAGLAVCVCSFYVCVALQLPSG